MVEELNVEVVYAAPDRAFVRRLRVPAGTTVSQAVEASGLAAEVPGLQVDPQRLGVFSRPVTPDAPVGEGDRIEIYRPLALDPKEARRRRARSA